MTETEWQRQGAAKLDIQKFNLMGNKYTHVYIVYSSK